MRLLKFKAEGVHGYLPFNLSFKPDLTFLTGINGSGKTTAINAILALLTPDLHTLSTLRYASLSVELAHEDERITITAVGDADTFSLSVSGEPTSLTVVRFVIDPDLPTPRQAEHEAEHFRDLAITHASHPVMKMLARLPTPMFLGLDRRSKFDAEDRRRLYSPWRHPRPGRNAFSPSLSKSLYDAADLAATSNRDALISAGRIGEELRRDMLLNLLTVSPENFGTITAPTASEVHELAQVRRDLETFPDIFKLPRDDVRNRVLPFLDALQEASRLVPPGTEPDEVFRQTPTNHKLVNAFFTWSANRSQLKRIRVISDVVQSYNDRRSSVLAPVRRYAELVNRFLKDSGKSIDFDDEGYVYVNIDGLDDAKDISSLSSGEAQIFVILTHLAFNQNAKRANVFIIDEPELSLHVLWQELFVESVQAANPQIQYIMATHSPSIILERTANCVDLSKVQKKKRKA